MVTTRKKAKKQNVEGWDFPRNLEDVPGKTGVWGQVGWPPKYTLAIFLKE